MLPNHKRPPRATQEGAKKLPRGTKKPQEAPKKRCPRGAQEDPKIPPRRTQNRNTNLSISMCFHHTGPGSPRKVPRAPKRPQEHPKSAPRPLSIQASEHLNLQVTSAGARKRKQFNCCLSICLPVCLVCCVCCLCAAFSLCLDHVWLDPVWLDPARLDPVRLDLCLYEF